MIGQEISNVDRFVTIIGAGGTGKTTVEVSLAHFLAEDFEGGVYFLFGFGPSQVRAAPTITSNHRRWCRRIPSTAIMNITATIAKVACQPLRWSAPDGSSAEKGTNRFECAASYALIEARPIERRSWRVLGTSEFYKPQLLSAGNSDVTA